MVFLSYSRSVAWKVRRRKAISVVLGRVVNVWTRWDDSKRVQVGVGRVVVELNVLHVDRLLDLWDLVKVAHILQAFPKQ